MSQLFRIESLSAGGPILVVLIFCSILGLALIVERFLYLRPAKVIPIDLLQRIEVSLKEGNLAEAIEITRQSSSPMMKVAEIALINADRPKEDLKVMIEEAGRLEVPRLEHYLGGLHTLAVVSPLLGLLGTVTGMIQVFETIVTEGTGNAQLLAGGISQAMLTTAFGLLVAIPTLVFHNYFSKKVDLLLVDMERHSLILFELLTVARES